MYATALRETTEALDVRSVLFVAGERDQWIEAACVSAGVAYLNVTSAEEAVIDRYANAMKSMMIGIR